jgi:hypothetical protein
LTTTTLSVAYCLFCLAVIFFCMSLAVWSFAILYILYIFDVI